jgi:hypothetical protein
MDPVIANPSTPQDFADPWRWIGHRHVAYHDTIS